MSAVTDILRSVDLAMALADRNFLRDEVLRLRDLIEAGAPLEQVRAELMTLFEFAAAMKGKQP